MTFYLFVFTNINLSVLCFSTRFRLRRTASCASVRLSKTATACATTPWMTTSISPCRLSTRAKRRTLRIWLRPWRALCWTWGLCWNRRHGPNCEAPPWSHVTWQHPSTGQVEPVTRRLCVVEDCALQIKLQRRQYNLWFYFVQTRFKQKWVGYLTLIMRLAVR